MKKEKTEKEGDILPKEEKKQNQLFQRAITEIIKPEETIVMETKYFKVGLTILKNKLAGTSDEVNTGTVLLDISAHVLTRKLGETVELEGAVFNDLFTSIHQVMEDGVIMAFPMNIEEGRASEEPAPCLTREGKVAESLLMNVLFPLKMKAITEGKSKVIGGVEDTLGEPIK